MEILKKIRDLLVGSLGGLFTGLLGSAFVQSLIAQFFEYQEGWYRQFAWYFFVPAAIFILYLVLLGRNRRFVLAILCVAPSFIIYVLARTFLPLDQKYAAIEFIFFGFLLLNSPGSVWSVHGRFFGKLLTNCSAHHQPSKPRNSLCRVALQHRIAERA